MKTVERGAEFLDERIPGWEEKIDLGTLDLTDTCNCVLGQLARAEHPRKRVWPVTPYGEMLRELHIETPSRLGFGWPPGVRRGADWTAAWVDVIRERLAQA